MSRASRTNYPQRACPTCGLVVVACNLPRHERQHGDERLRTRVPLDEQPRMVELYRKGHSMKRIAELTWWGETTVRRVLLANGVTLRPPGTGRPSSPSHIDVDERLKRTALYGRGLSLEEVAAACGVTREAVRQTLLREGVALRGKTNLRWQRRRRESLAAAREAA